MISFPKCPFHFETNDKTLILYLTLFEETIIVNTSTLSYFNYKLNNAMKNLLLTISIILFLLTKNVFGQNKTYVGAEIGIINDIYEIADNGNALKKVPLVNGIWGFNLRQDVNSYLFLETGLVRKYYSEGVGFKNFSSSTSTNAINAWMIPLKLGTKINLYKEKFYLTPVIGYSYCINSSYGAYGYGGGYIQKSSDSVSFTYTNTKDLARHFSLLQTGIGFEFKLFKSALLSISTNYFTGFKKVVELDVNYSFNNSPYVNGKIFSKGEFWSLGIGLRYPIINWGKNKA